MELPIQLKLIEQHHQQKHQQKHQEKHQQKHQEKHQEKHQQKHQEKHQQKLATLPFTTSFSNYILPLTLPNQHSSNLFHLSFRHLSLVLIRELAILEDLFIQSPIYRLIRYLTPSFLLPQSSTYPFLLTIIVALIQLRKIWIRQPKLLVNLFISLAPIVHTLRALNAFDVHYDPHYLLPSSSSPLIFESTHHLHQLKRWSIYWLLYCTLINLESSNVRVKDSFRRTLLPTRPTIYPSIPQTTKIDRLSAFNLSISNKIAQLSNFFSSRCSRSSLFDLIIPKSIVKASSKSLQLQGHTLPKISMPPLDIYPPATRVAKHIKRVPLPQYLFGKNEKVYTLLKVVLLKWCSSQESRVLEMIWSGFLSPIASLIGCVGSDPTSKKNRVPRFKVVKVTVSSNEEEEGEDNEGNKELRLGPNLPESRESNWRTTHEELYPKADQRQAQTQKIVGKYSGSSPMRRRRSDPGRGSVSLVSTVHRPPSSELLLDTHDHSRSGLQNIHSIRSSCSHTSLHSTNPSTALELLDEKDSHPSISILKHSSSALTHSHHPLFEFKTPENAWDSLSYNG